jgi:hypothetical protein
VGAEDARKQRNLGENFSILRNGQLLSVEKRGLLQYPDTAFFKMWNMQQSSYRLEIVSLHLEAEHCEALIEDKFLGTTRTILLNGKTDFNFEITENPASAAEDRFEIIFRQCPSMPLPDIGMLDCLLKELHGFPEKNQHSYNNGYLSVVIEPEEINHYVSFQFRQD